MAPRTPLQPQRQLWLAAIGSLPQPLQRAYNTSAAWLGEHVDARVRGLIALNLMTLLMSR